MVCDSSLTLAYPKGVTWNCDLKSSSFEPAGNSIFIILCWTPLKILKSVKYLWGMYSNTGVHRTSYLLQLCSVTLLGSQWIWLFIPNIWSLLAKWIELGMMGNSFNLLHKSPAGRGRKAVWLTRRWKDWSAKGKRGWKFVDGDGEERRCEEKD